MVHVAEVPLAPVFSARPKGFQEAPEMSHVAEVPPAPMFSAHTKGSQETSQVARVAETRAFRRHLKWPWSHPGKKSPNFIDIRG